MLVLELVLVPVFMVVVIAPQIYARRAAPLIGPAHQHVARIEAGRPHGSTRLLPRRGRGSNAPHRCIYACPRLALVSSSLPVASGEQRTHICHRFHALCFEWRIVANDISTITVMQVLLRLDRMARQGLALDAPLRHRRGLWRAERSCTGFTRSTSIHP